MLENYSLILSSRGRRKNCSTNSKESPVEPMRLNRFLDWRKSSLSTLSSKKKSATLPATPKNTARSLACRKGVSFDRSHGPSKSSSLEPTFACLHHDLTT